MSIVVETFIICDNCGESFGVDMRSDTGAQHRLNSKKEGWQFYNGKDYCPKCSFCTPNYKKNTKNEKSK